MLLAVLLVSVAVAAAGPVPFAGFLAGPIAKALNAGRTTLLGAMLTGAALVTAADYVGAYLDRRPQPARRRRHRRLRRTVPAVAAGHRAHDKELLMTIALTRSARARPARRPRPHPRLRRTGRRRRGQCRAPPRQGHRHRRGQRLRQVDPAARDGPAPQAARREVLLDGKSIHGIPTKEVARTLGLLPQNPIAPEGVTVVDLVGRGRTPHQGRFQRWSAAGRSRRGPRARGHRHPRPRRPRRGRAVRRPAAAGLDRDGARPGDRPAAARRADDLPRRRPPGRGARPAARPQRLARHDHRHGAARAQPRRPLRRPPRSPCATGRSAPSAPRPT